MIVLIETLPSRDFIKATNYSSLEFEKKKNVVQVLTYVIQGSDKCFRCLKVYV